MDDKTIIRDLAKKVQEFTQSDINKERRNLWRDHNSLVRTRPLLKIDTFAAKEVSEIQNLQCVDPAMRDIERYFRRTLYHIGLNDDTVFEPWFTVRAAFAYPEAYNMRWGSAISLVHSGHEGGAYNFDPVLKSEEDLNLLKMPHHEINETLTRERYEKAKDLLEDIITVRVDRSPFYKVWTGDVSTDIVYLRGLEQMMYDMIDSPEFIHKLASFMSEGILSVHDTAEKAGDFTVADGENQAVIYARDLDDPVEMDGYGPSVTRDKMWMFCSSQETAIVSPSMWEEFILTYQVPIYSKFGLLAYGCCEDLTRRIPILKKAFANLRRIAVTPWADFRGCAEQIGTDYVLSWRPSPADMVADNFDPERVRRTVSEALTMAKEHNNHIDITLKDVETVSGNMNAVPGFVQVVRELIEA